MWWCWAPPEERLAREGSPDEWADDPPDVEKPPRDTSPRVGLVALTLPSFNFSGDVPREWGRGCGCVCLMTGVGGALCDARCVSRACLWVLCVCECVSVCAVCCVRVCVVCVSCVSCARVSCVRVCVSCVRVCELCACVCVRVPPAAAACSPTADDGVPPR